jgi:dihydroxyacetone kinase
VTHFVDDVDSIVTQALDAIVRSSGGALHRLDGYPDVKVVLRSDWTADRVALVSGGGAGHEPAHAGFVGRGLLTAAVSGEIFASPTSDAVLAAIVAVTGEAGCLLITKNYTGDRLNFGLAVERARSIGLKVEMVVVSDDIALPDASQPRGLAGTLLVHKVAGALAERGAPLAEVAEAARLVATTVRSLGVSLSGANIPGRPAPDRFQEGRAELGLGIHGEPGAATLPLSSTSTLLVRMVVELAALLPRDAAVAVLVNNLGGLSGLEMGVVLDDLFHTELGARVQRLIGPASLMTSMDMRGFSLSVMPMDERLAALLDDAPAQHTAWPGTRAVGELTLAPVPDITGRQSAPASANPAVQALILRICAALVASETLLNALDAKVGDGDTGSTFAGVARRLAAHVEDLPLDDTPALLEELSVFLAGAMGGSSGVLGAVFFAAAGRAANEGAELADALVQGAHSMQGYGGAQLGDRSLVDALMPALTALHDGHSLTHAAAAAQAGAEATAGMTRAGVGRSSYLATEHLVGMQDPGAAAVAIIFSAGA